MSNSPLIVALGEVLWDMFPDGARLGGAPANFGVHCSALGAQVALISCVGNDDLGNKAKLALGEHGVDIGVLGVDAEHATGTVAIHLTDGQPSYKIVEDVAWDHIVWCDEFEALAKTANAVCFGSLAQRSPLSRETIQRFVDVTQGVCLRVLDVNFRQHYHTAEVMQQSLALANVMKLNDEEVPILRDYVGGCEDGDEFLLELRDRFALDVIILTLGADGCRVFEQDDVCSFKSEPQNVVNTVGAGDAFTAAFVSHYLNGDDLEACAVSANALGGYVATQDSATPHLPNHFCVWS